MSTQTNTAARAEEIAEAVEELIEALNDYRGDDWFNDVAADYDDILDHEALDGPDGHRYRTDRLPIIGGGIVEPSGHDWFYHGRVRGGKS